MLMPNETPELVATLGKQRSIVGWMVYIRGVVEFDDRICVDFQPDRDRVMLCLDTRKEQSSIVGCFGLEGCRNEIW